MRAAIGDNDMLCILTVSGRNLRYVGTYIKDFSQQDSYKNRKPS